MGYFPLPELKGKPNRILVDGKTLNQIAKESGIRLDTVQHRYSRGVRDYEGLTKPSHIRVEHEKAQEPKKKQAITLNAEYDDLGAGRKIFRGKYYIVQKGDNLWNIAKRFYGAGAEYYRIVRKNHLQDPNHIEVGQKLYL